MTETMAAVAPQLLLRLLLVFQLARK